MVVDSASFWGQLFLMCGLCQHWQFYLAFLLTGSLSSDCHLNVIMETDPLE